jgi:hypothetical protein
MLPAQRSRPKTSRWRPSTYVQRMLDVAAHPILTLASRRRRLPDDYHEGPAAVEAVVSAAAGVGLVYTNAPAAHDDHTTTVCQP